MATIIVSAIISAITSKIVATYYFKKVDGYVKEMCEMTKKSNQHTLAILHKLQENPKGLPCSVSVCEEGRSSSCKRQQIAKKY